jgi:double zinc ribbon protein
MAGGDERARSHGLPEVRPASLPEPPPDPGRCPHCQMPIAIGATFCNACGRRLVPDAPPAVALPDDLWVSTDCPHCGRPLESGVIASSEDPAAGGIFGDLSFFPPQPEGTRSFKGEPVLIWVRPNAFSWDRKDEWPKWQLCRNCRLLRYPPLD